MAASERATKLKCQPFFFLKDGGSFFFELVDADAVGVALDLADNDLSLSFILMQQRLQ